MYYSLLWFLLDRIWIVASTYHLLCAWQGLVWRVMGWACGGLTPTLAGMRCLSTRRNILLCFSCNDAEKLFDMWFCICSWSINWYHTFCEQLGKKGLELLIFTAGAIMIFFEIWYILFICPPRASTCFLLGFDPWASFLQKQAIVGFYIIYKRSAK